MASQYGITTMNTPMTYEVNFTSGAASTVFTVPLPTAGDRCSGLIFFDIYCSDGTDYQNISWIGAYSAVNKAGTVTGDATYSATGQSKNTTGGTLTTTFTDTTGTPSTDAVFQITPTSSLTLTSARIRFTFIQQSGNIPVSMGTLV